MELGEQALGAETDRDTHRQILGQTHRSGKGWELSVVPGYGECKAHVC